MPKKKIAKKAGATQSTRKTKTGARKRDKEEVSFPCSTFRQGKHELVLFLARAKVVFDITEANRLVEDKDEGYQRAVSPARRKKIANFIDDGNAMPLSVLVSFDKATLNEDKTELHVPNIKNAGWVIDGQHRLAGASDAKKDIVIPVVAFIALDEEEQINQFVTINREQTGVPTSLYYELLARLPKTKSESEIVAERAMDLARALRRDDNSPFFNRIVSTSSARQGRISTTNFVRKIAPYLRRDNGCLYIYTDEQRQRILNNYYNAIRAVRGKEFGKPDSVFFRTIGFGALMNVLPTVLQLSVHFTGGLAVEDMVALLEKITDWDPTSWGNIGTGNAAERRAAEDMTTLLYQLKESGEIGAGSIRL